VTENIHVQDIDRTRLNEAVDVLCEAFFDYPVMRFVIGDAEDDYSRRLKQLVCFFTEARFLRRDPVLAVCEHDRITAVANINRPGSAVTSVALDTHRERLWADLGDDARRRYEAYRDVTGSFVYPEPHFHLGMIGVRQPRKGRGHARRLLDALHEMSRSHPTSRGVSLTTESLHNVPLYQHFGYQIVGHGCIGAVETWGFFRPESRLEPSRADNA